MNPKASENPVLKFIVDRVPDDLLLAYEILVQLQYPLTDRKTFLEQLEKRQTDTDKLAQALLREFLDVDAFPISSLQNAFEKFHSRLPHDLKFMPLQRDLPTEAFLLPAGPERLILPSAVPGATIDPNDIRDPRGDLIMEAFLRYLNCQRNCDEAYARCIRNAHGERDQLRCALNRTLCQNRCRRAS